MVNASICCVGLSVVARCQNPLDRSILERVPKGTSSYQAAWIVEETPDDDAEILDLDQPNQLPMENESD